ncbi:hypothetical protein FS837_011050 [Tulasnella sp. UAMH 9824]|nr:hypothetical protein FS837_011050 [Tulasnella sp. UAMH 9824]
MRSPAFQKFMVAFIHSFNEYHARTPVIQKNRSVVWPIKEAAIEGITESGAIRFDNGQRADYGLIDVTAASIYQCVNSHRDMVALLDYMAFQALQVAAFIIPPEADPDNDIVHRAVGGAIVPAPVVLELIRKDPNGPRAKKFRATLIIILGGCFCRCARWDTLETPKELNEAIQAEADRCAAQLIEVVRSPSDSPAAKVLADFGCDELILCAREYLMDDSSPNFGTMFPLQVLIHVLLSEGGSVAARASVRNGFHAAILRRFWIIVRRGSLLSREEVKTSRLTLSLLMASYAGFHGQAATNKNYLKLTFQWDLLAFFARCLLVAERMDEVKQVEESIKETAKALKSDSAIFGGIVTPLWFGILKGLTERERLRPILYDLAAEELKMEARLNTRYCCNCPPDCPHARGFVTPSEVTRTALDAWRGFGYALGLDEEELINRATARLKGDDNEELDEPLKPPFLMLVPRKTALDEFMWELFAFEGDDDSIEVIRKHYDLRTFWPMTEGIINNMREYRGCTVPEGAAAVPALELTIYYDLKRIVDASLSSKVFASVLEIFSTLVGWLREDSIAEPVLTLRAAFIAMMGAVTQEKGSFEEMMSVLIALSSFTRFSEMT